MRPPIRTLVILFALVIGPLAFAAGDPATPGALRVAGKDGAVVEMPLKHTAVSIEVTAFVARATIEQVFENPFDDPVEAVYTFPLGARAAVDDFELVVGDRTIRGTIKRRDEARQVYETARAAGYQAALLEQERPNIFTQSVANLEPHKAVTVRLRTVETLVYERGIYRLTFPLVVGPRYIPGGVRDAARIAPPVLAPGLRSGHDVAIRVTIDAGVPFTALRSPSHRVVIEKSGATTASVRLAPDDTIPNKDFLLQWNVSQERPAVGVLAHRDGLDGFFTLLVQPKGEIGITEAMPKEITFVVDTSGSMSGIPLEASKRLAAKALRALGPRDTFNLIRFAGDNELFSNDALPGDRGSIERAVAWLDRARGGGGTELMAAMRAAFERPKDPNRLRLVVFLTDGYVGNEPEILGSIGKVIGDARIYTVGIGSSVNHHLLESMADLGRGAYVFVRPDDAADDALEAFRSWVTLPYLTDLTIDWGALPVADVEPERLRDLGSGQTLTIVGRYLGVGEGDVVVRGRLGGRHWEQRTHVVLPDREARHDALASLWARGRIESLLRETGADVPDSVEAEVTALALAYRLMSPYTSFVAVDDSAVVNPNGNPRVVHQALPMPEGVSFEGVFGKNGPAGIEAKDEKAEPEDEVSGAAMGGVAGDGSADRAEPMMVTAPARAVVGQDKVKVAFARKENAARSRSVDRNVMTLFPAGSEETDAGARLRDTAFRVLADLADDGTLSASEGRPALAALLAAQRSNGAIASDVATHAIATWALAEAAAVLPNDPWVARAKGKAAAYLVAIKSAKGWPARVGGSFDSEATLWSRLVLASLRPGAIGDAPLPDGRRPAAYARLRDALAGARSGGAPVPPAGCSAFERLLASMRRGNLQVISAGI